MTTEEAPKRTAGRDQIRQWQSNLDDEINGIAIYHMLAKAERDAERYAAAALTKHFEGGKRT